MKPFLWMVLIGSLCGVFLFYVWGKVDGVRAGYELDALLKKKAALEQEHERLQIRLSQLIAPDRIASEAKTQLEMTPPRPGQVFLVTGDPEHTKPGEADRLPFRLAQR